MGYAEWILVFFGVLAGGVLFVKHTLHDIKRCPLCQSPKTEKAPNRIITGWICHNCQHTFSMALLVMLFSFPAFATDLTLQSGWEHTQNSNYGDAVQFNARLETPLYLDLNVGVELGYHGKSEHAPYGDLSGQTLLGELIYNIPVSWTLKPYIFGGWGWSWWQFDRSTDMENAGIAIDLGDSFANKYGVGANYPINDKWSFNIEWNYFHSHVPKDSYFESDGSFANVVGGDTVGEEETNILVGIKYKF